MPSEKMAFFVLLPTVGTYLALLRFDQRVAMIRLVYYVML